jgi:hypothetical protein
MQAAAPCEMPQHRQWITGLRGLDNRVKVRSPLCQRQGPRVPIAHSTAALVVADEPGVSREELDPVLPYRALPFIFEVSEPIGRFYQRRTGA